MSSEDVLTEDDRKVLDHLDDEISEAESEEELQDLVYELKSELRDHKLEFRKYQNAVESRFNALERKIENSTSVAEDDEEIPPIARYADIPEDERDDLLSTSEQIAVTLHENWHDIAWTMGGGSNYAGATATQRFGVDTKTKANAKYNPSMLKHRLEKHVGRELRSNEVYRGMKQLAKLADGEEHVDENARVRVVGGWYYYEERATADGKDMKRVLWEVEE